MNAKSFRVINSLLISEISLKRVFLHSSLAKLDGQFSKICTVGFYADSKMSATILKVLFLSYCLLVLEMMMYSTKFVSKNLQLIPTSFTWTTNIKVTTESSSLFLKRSVGRKYVQLHAKAYTAKNPVISPNFLVWKFYGKAQFPHSFGRIARNYAETVPFHKISTPENQVKLRDFSQCYDLGKTVYSVF